MKIRGLLPLVLLACGVLCACATSSAPIAGPSSVVLPTANVRASRDNRLPTTPAVPPTLVPTLRSTPSLLPTAISPTATPPILEAVLVGAGDIANCDPAGAEATARLLDHIEGTVITLGDHAYPDGTPADFERCYEPTWGRHKARTRPSPGNHDYHTRGAAAYYAYFGDNAGPAGQDYYSYSLGAWHIVSLNSSIDAGPRSPQAEWLRAELAANSAVCTLAYWHHPLFSSGAVHGNNAKMQTIWDILDEAGADVVVAGHEHTYERFAPQTAAGVADQNGIRQFVVGTGGAGRYAFGDLQPNSETRSNDTFGVLKLTLRAASYQWQFVPVEAETLSDSGSAACVGPDQ
jgi:hypothetical protein